MIKAEYQPAAMTLTVEGHSNSAPKGEDLICSAVSILVMTLSDAVEEICSRKELTFRTGYARIRGDEMAMCDLEFACRGLRLLAEMYPKYITYREK